MILARTSVVLGHRRAAARIALPFRPVDDCVETDYDYDCDCGDDDDDWPDDTVRSCCTIAAPY